MNYCHSSIAILMATYNGENYLRNQIDSIINQEYRDWTLYISDDGSNDTTNIIISEYCSKYPNIKSVKKLNYKRGAKYTFFDLLSQVDAQYYMFCDQDDVWLPQKISLSFDRIKELEKYNPNVPIVVHTDLTVVDENLKILSNSFWNSSRIKPHYLNSFNKIGVCNCATGCTMIFNKYAKTISLPTPDEADMHDWWITLLSARNGIVSYVDKQLILYRQHNNNSVGARDRDYKYFIERLCEIKNTIESNVQQYRYLKTANYGSVFKFILYKAIYQIVRQF